MAIKRSSAIIAVLVVLVLILSSTLIAMNLGSNNKNTATSGSPITITDALNRTVSVSEAPKRIVSVAPSITESICAIGLESRLVGVTDYCDYPASIAAMKANKTLPSIGGYWDPNVEAIAVLNPDIVFLTASVSAQIQMLPSLEELNITTVVLSDESNISEVCQDIIRIGTICDVKDVATSYVSSMESKISEISAFVSNVTSKKSIAYLLYGDTYWVAGGATYIQDLINDTKATNVFSSESGWVSISEEGLLEANPDVIIIDGDGMAGTTPQELLSTLRNDTLWSTLTAVKTDSVYVLTGQASNAFDRAGPRLVDAIELMADMLYPLNTGVSLPTTLDSNYTTYLKAAGQQTDDNIPQTIVDGLGRTVTLTTQPTRIVSTSNTITEMLYALGMRNDIIGVNSDNASMPDTIVGMNLSDGFPSDIEARIANGTVATTGETWSQNAETIAALNPDLVILDYNSWAYSGIGDQLSSFGIPYIVTGQEVSLGQIYNNIQVIGNAVGKEC